MGVEPKIGGFTPKMDGENNGKPYEQMDDLGGNPLVLETPNLVSFPHLNFIKTHVFRLQSGLVQATAPGEC